MNELNRLDLERMIKENDVKDCTEEIREKKHSDLIRKDINALLEVKKKNLTLSKTNPEEFDVVLTKTCPFLFTNYTDIFNRIKKDEIDMNILWQLLDILKKIEMNKLDQHSGSFEVGKLLKAIYIDSALKKAAKLDEKYPNESMAPTSKNITWKSYKNIAK